LPSSEKKKTAFTKLNPVKKWEESRTPPDLLGPPFGAERGNRSYRKGNSSYALPSRPRKGERPTKSFFEPRPHLPKWNEVEEDTVAKKGRERKELSVRENVDLPHRNS